MVPPTESSRFVAGELGKSGRKLEQIGAKFLGPNRFEVFFLTWRNAYLHFHDLGNIGKLEANLDSFKTPQASSSVSGKKNCDDLNNRIILCDVVDCLLRTSER